jgi:hypothetical protein
VHNNFYTITAERRDSEVPYIVVNIADLERAMTTLSGNGFKLFMYLYRVQWGKIWRLSPEDVRQRTGMSQNGYHKAFAELIERGYLIKTSKRKVVFKV